MINHSVLIGVDEQKLGVLLITFSIKKFEKRVQQFFKEKD
jgi:hypothetical protein